MASASASLYLELEGHVRRWVRWVRVRDSLAWMARGALLGLAASVALAVAARLQPVLDLQQLLQYSAVLVIGVAGLGGLLAFAWPRATLHAARAFDIALGLDERTSTALELAATPAAAPAFLAQQQLADAVVFARRTQVRAQLPLRNLRREMLVSLILLALIAAAIVLPNEQLRTLAAQREVEAAIAEQVAALEEIRADIRNDESLTEAQQEELIQPLDQAITELQGENITQEEAVSILAGTEQQLRELGNAEQIAQQSQSLQQAGAALREGELTGQAGQEMQAGDLAGAAESLRALDPSNLTAEEQQQLAQQLEAAAEQLQDTNPNIATELQEAAEALREGDAAAASSALEQAAQGLEQIASERAQAQAAQQAAGEVQQGQQEIAGSQQAGQPTEGGSAAGAQQGPAGAEQGQSEQPGEGSSAAGQGESDAAAQGGEAGTQPIGENAAGDGGERAYEPIYSPERLGGEGGRDVQIDSGDGQGEEIVAENPTTPDEDGGATVPYNEVFPEYSEEAHSAIESGEVPVGLRPVVREYFENLEPGN